MRPTPRRVFLLSVLVGALLLAPTPFSGRLGRAVQDLGHIPLAGLLAALLFVGLRSRLPRSDVGAAVLVWLTVTGALGALEFLQGYVNRGRSWRDALTNALAAAALLVAAAAWRQGRLARAAGLLVGVLLVVVAAWRPLRTMRDLRRQARAMPLIASFEDELELERWRRAETSRIRRSTEHGTHGLYSLRVDLDPGPWPGATLSWPVPDWRGWRELVFDVTVVGDEPLPFTLKIPDEDCDHTYDDAYHLHVTLAPGRHEVRVPLEDVRLGPRDRTTDLARIASFQFFVVRPKTSRTFYLDHIRLVGRDAP